MQVNWLEERRKGANRKVDIAELIKLRETGMTQNECCKKFGVHQRVIRRILDAHGLPRSIPSQIIGTCPICGKEYRKDRNSQRSCSKKCGIKLQANPLADEHLITEMYLSEMTQQEIADKIGISLKSVQKALKRSGIKSRKAAKREQRKENNSNWKGKGIGYKGAHQRVRAQRGDPQVCEHCGKDKYEARLHWANVNREYHNPYDYIPLCVKCHKKFDTERKKNVN